MSVSDGRDHPGPGDDAVLSTVFRLFMERGLNGFSVTDVVAATGVSEEDLARRGSSKAELVVAAVEAQVPPLQDCPNTGTLRTDLIVLVQHQIDLFLTYDAVLQRAFDAATTNADYAAAAWAISVERLARYRPVFERGIARGELDAQVDVDRALEMLFGLVWNRHLDGRAVETAMAEPIVEVALSGLGAPLA